MIIVQPRRSKFKSVEWISNLKLVKNMNAYDAQFHAYEYRGEKYNIVSVIHRLKLKIKYAFVESDYKKDTLIFPWEKKTSWKLAFPGKGDELKGMSRKYRAKKWMVRVMLRVREDAGEEC